jgi:hypothetical protein
MSSRERGIDRRRALQEANWPRLLTTGPREKAMWCSVDAVNVKIVADDPDQANDPKWGLLHHRTDWHTFRGMHLGDDPGHLHPVGLPDIPGADAYVPIDLRVL